MPPPPGIASPVRFPATRFVPKVRTEPLTTKTPVALPVTVVFDRRIVGVPVCTVTPMLLYETMHDSRFTSVSPTVPAGSCAETPTPLLV
jgi:hypothetical protein